MISLNQYVLFAGQNAETGTAMKRALAGAFQLANASKTTMLDAETAYQLFRDTNLASSFVSLAGSSIKYLTVAMSKDMPAREFFAAFFYGSPMNQEILERLRSANLTWKQLGEAVAAHFASLGIEWQEEWLYLIADTRILDN